MNTGMNVNDLAVEIERQANSKRDLVTSTSNLAIELEDDVPSIVIADKEQFAIGDVAHGQLAEHTGIPKAYYDRMLVQEPKLYADSVNTWLHKNPADRMLRILDAKMRAFLSNKYRRIDNIDLGAVALVAIKEAGMDVVSAGITEKHLYIKAVDPKIQRHIPNGFKMGDGSHQFFKVPSGDVCPAIMVRNSEVGFGNGEVVGGLLDGGCTNLAWMFKQRGMKKMHIGARLEVGEEMYRWLSDETQKVTDEAIFLQFRDAVRVAISVEGFDDLIEQVSATTLNKIEADPVKVVELTARKFMFNDTQRASILTHLVNGGDLSQFGLSNAVTSMANEQIDYDVSSLAEGVGGKIIELPKSEWKALSSARDFKIAA